MFIFKNANQAYKRILNAFFCDHYNQKNISFGIPNDIGLYNEDDLHLPIPESEVDRLRQKYTWLDNIKNWNNTFINAECQICKKKLLNEDGYPKFSLIWWFGHHKSICPDCCTSPPRAQKQPTMTSSGWSRRIQNRPLFLTPSKDLS